MTINGQRDLLAEWGVGSSSEEIFIIGLPCAPNVSVRRQTVLDTTTTTNISNCRRRVNALHYANYSARDAFYFFMPHRI